MEIVSYNSCSDLDALEEAWEHLAEQGLYFIPSFSELKHRLVAGGAQFRLLVAVDNSTITAIACFIYGNSRKNYEIALRRLFGLPVKVVTLFGSCVLGEPSEDIVKRFFGYIIEERGFDLIDVGEIFVDLPLYRAIVDLGGGTIAWKTSRGERRWWLIRLPRSFDEYIASLRAGPRVHLTRDCRRFEREAPDLRVIQHPHEIAIFLRDAEEISRLTYQRSLWNSLPG